MRLRFAIPSLFTFTGHVLAIGWLVGVFPWSAGLLALVFDCLDGQVARRTRATSEFGALYDWAVDITVGVLILQRLHIEWLAVVIVPFMAWFHLKKFHFSGRTVLTFIALLVLHS